MNGIFSGYTTCKWNPPFWNFIRCVFFFFCFRLSVSPQCIMSLLWLYICSYCCNVQLFAIWFRFCLFPRSAWCHDVIIMNLWLYIFSSACCNFQLFAICYPVAMITNQFLLSISALVIYLTSFLDMHLLVFDLSSMLWDLDGKIVMLVSFPYLYLFMIMYLFTAKKGPFFLRMLLWPFCTHKRWERSQTITEKSLAFYWVLESGKSLLHVT